MDDHGDFTFCQVKSQDTPTSTRQATAGSLSFKAADRSAAKKVSSTAPGDSGSSTKDLQKQNACGKKPVARAKVPFEKGYSQMDWLKLTRTHPDVAGLKGQSSRRLITMNEVKQHQMEGSMWTALKGRVYNLSPYLKFHPGGVDILMKAIGKDCTSLFTSVVKAARVKLLDGRLFIDQYHAWVNAEFLLEKCLVGILDEGQQDLRLLLQ